MAEAHLENVGSGLAPVSDGWFVVNSRDAAWVNNDRFGGVCIFESDEFILQERPDLPEAGFAHAGFTLRVVEPGRLSGGYHFESEQQEDFLVLMGECILLIEGEERQLQTWDFVHCPPGTAHTFVGAGDGPCVILGAGNRTDTSETVDVPSEAADRHAAVEKQGASESAKKAHTGIRGWRVEHPERWDELPWAR
jgi:uncharacterized cupin superfamily protein